MSVEKASYLQIERPVLGGGRDFLARARELGDSVLGNDVRISITELAIVPEDDGNQAPRFLNVLRPVREPNFEISAVESLKVVLLHRRALNHVASKYAFGTNVIRFDKPLPPVYPSGATNTLPFKKQTLFEQLDKVSIDAGQDPKELPVWFDSVSVVARKYDRIIFGLEPRQQSEAFYLLKEQELVSEQRLRQQSVKLADLEGVSDNLAIRFASAPGHMSEHLIDQLLGRLQELPPVRLTLGAPEPRFKNSRQS